MLPVAVEPSPRLGRSTIPLATLTLIGLNAASWVLLQGLGLPEPMLQSICQYGLIPAELTGELRAGDTIALGPDAVCVCCFRPVESGC